MKEARNVNPQGEEISGEVRDKIDYLDQLTEDLNAAFCEEINEEGLEEHKAMLVQNFLNLGVRTTLLKTSKEMLKLLS